jgi:hypothetical protein
MKPKKSARQRAVDVLCGMKPSRNKNKKADERWEEMNTDPVELYKRRLNRKISYKITGE